MEKIEMWKSSDGQYFENAFECEKHESTLSANVLDKYVQGFDSEGRPINWGDEDAYAWYAHLTKYPSGEELEDPVFDKAWADYLDSDLEVELTACRTPGWYVRDPYSEMWYCWSDYAREFNRIKDTMVELREKWGF